jgi:hypothetical protein
VTVQSTSVGGGNFGGTGFGNGDDGDITLEVTSAPAPPSNLAATVTNGTTVELTWTAGTGTDTVNIYRGTEPGIDTGSATPIASVSSATTSYTDTGLAEGVQYHYVVEGVASVSVGTSDEASATTDLPAPTDLSITSVVADGGDLSWTLNSTDEDGVLVETRLTGASSWTEQADLAAGSESYTLSGLLHGREYEARVAAYTADRTEYDT